MSDANQNNNVENNEEGFDELTVGNLKKLLEGYEDDQRVIVTVKFPIDPDNAEEDKGLSEEELEEKYTQFLEVNELDEFEDEDGKSVVALCTEIEDENEEDDEPVDDGNDSSSED